MLTNSISKINKNITLTLSVLYLFATSFAFAAEEYVYDDWIIAPECYKLGSPNCDKLCRGYYLEPEFDELDGSVDSNALPIEIESDEGSFISKGNSIFKGNVAAAQGNKKIYSDKASIRHNEETGKLELIHSESNVKILEPGVRIDGDEAFYFPNSEEKSVKNAKFRLYPNHARGTSTNLRTKGKYLTYLPNATYTTCPPKNNSWQLKAKKVKLNKESGRGEAWHSKLYVKDIPVFYWPYMNFPIDDRRQTGFLQPTFKTSSNFGKSIITPYYWNIAPNYDATFTPYFSVKRNFRLLSEFRYLTSNSGGIFAVDFIPHDRTYREFREEKLADPRVAANSAKKAALKDINSRFAFSFKNKTSFTQDLTLYLDYSHIGDDNYLKNIGPEVIQSHQNLDSIPGRVNVLETNNTPIISDRPTAVVQMLDLKYQHKLGNANFLMQQFQTLHPFDNDETTEQYRKLPEISASLAEQDLPLGFSTSMQFIYTDFKIRRNFNAASKATYGKRYYFSPVISRNFIESGWYVKPSFKIRHVKYNLNLSDSDISNNKPNSPDITIPIYSVDTGLFFERDLKILKSDFVQTLEPRAYFLYTPYRDQTDLPIFDTGTMGFSYDQLFRDNNFSGFDRVSRAKQVSLGLVSKFLTEETLTEKASVGVGQAFYLNNFNDSNRSPIAGFATYNLHPHWNMSTNLVVDNSTYKLRTITFNTQYKPEKYKVLNFGYTFTRDYSPEINPIIGKKNHLRQVHISGAWPIDFRLRAIGKMEYDIQRQNFINILAGLEHQGCCTNFRVVLLRTRTSIETATTSRKHDTSIGFQVVFKGLGGTGSADSGMVASYIPGYEVPSNNKF